jgi:hypothetical protein
MLQLCPNVPLRRSRDEGMKHEKEVLRYAQDSIEACCECLEQRMMVHNNEMLLLLMLLLLLELRKRGSCGSAELFGAYRWSGP